VSGHGDEARCSGGWGCWPGLGPLRRARPRWVQSPGMCGARVAPWPSRCHTSRWRSLLVLRAARGAADRWPSTGRTPSRLCRGRCPLRWWAEPRGGGFKWSSQRLIEEGCDGQAEGGGRRVGLGDRLCVRRGVRPSVAGSIASGSGRRSLVDWAARRPGSRRVCRRRSASGGFGRVAACHLSVRLRCRGGICRRGVSI